MPERQIDPNGRFASSRRTVAPALAAGTFAIGVEAIVISGLLPEISRDMHVSGPVVGQLVTAFALGYAILAPALAHIVSGYSQRAVLSGGLALFALANSLAAISPNFPVLIGTTILASAAAAVYTPSAVSAVARTSSPQQRGRSMAAVLSGAAVASVIGVPLGLYLSSELGWRATFASIAGIAIVAGLVVSTTVSGETFPRESRSSLKALHDFTTRTLVIVTFLAYLAEFMVYSYLGVGLITVAGLQARNLPIYYLFFGIAGLLGNLVAGWASDQWGSRAVTHAALVLMALSLVAFPMALESRWAVLAPLVGCGFAAWLISVPQQRRLISRAHGSSLTALGLSQSALYLGISFSGLCGGIAAEAVGVDKLGYVATGFVIIALLTSRAVPSQDVHKKREALL